MKPLVRCLFSGLLFALLFGCKATLENFPSQKFHSAEIKIGKKYSVPYEDHLLKIPYIKTFVSECLKAGENTEEECKNRIGIASVNTFSLKRGAKIDFQVVLLNPEPDSQFNVVFEITGPNNLSVKTSGQVIRSPQNIEDILAPTINLTRTLTIYEPEKWHVGKWTIDAIVNDTKVATGEFEMTDYLGQTKQTL